MFLRVLSYLFFALKAVAVRGGASGPRTVLLLALLVLLLVLLVWLLSSFTTYFALGPGRCSSRFQSRSPFPRRSSFGAGGGSPGSPDLYTFTQCFYTFLDFLILRTMFLHFWSRMHLFTLRIRSDPALSGVVPRGRKSRSRSRRRRSSKSQSKSRSERKRRSQSKNRSESKSRSQSKSPSKENELE